LRRAGWRIFNSGVKRLLIRHLPQSCVLAGPFVPFTVEGACAKQAPRTSIVLAERARQRRLERRKRRLKHQRRRQARARVTAWLYALGRWPFEALRRCTTPDLPFPEPVSLAYALRAL
jgi:hypothetical protein